MGIAGDGSCIVTVRSARVEDYGDHARVDITFSDGTGDSIEATVEELKKSFPWHYAALMEHRQKNGAREG